LRQSHYGYATEAIFHRLCTGGLDECPFPFPTIKMGINSLRDFSVAVQWVGTRLIVKNMEKNIEVKCECGSKGGDITSRTEAFFGLKPVCRVDAFEVNPHLALPSTDRTVTA
jgi:hypothetical protein